ncbi:phosphatase PAP2 family protein [Capnocytophaga sp. oral taxon 380]|uniref:phosphatase PAP2 family protein n=1 Tax=Capnocytophaga sp. oral taxon 380 TaxID=712217 RepID=UPI0002A3DDC8|nr:phosphatase PAP2 family protein [Capnocytophaga sp. oral taxon 380]EKY04251.1 PAP2 family protein [Capnocytophaga sp. oral taxon 380 str. F0488]
MKYLLLLFLIIFPLSPALSQETDSIPESVLDSLFDNLEKGGLEMVNTNYCSFNRSYKINKHLTYEYKKPRFVDIFNKIPHNIGKSAVEMVSKPNYPYGLAAIGATAALIPADPWLIRESRSLGENLGLNEAHTYKKLGFLKIVPADVNSAMYFIGNGTTFIIISGGMATYGLITGDYRAKSTAMQILESIIVSGAFVQPIKRLTGRESPFITADDGRWHSQWTFAPSFKAYQEDTPMYDAMPSGHLTTAMSALTVIAENYPDYKWIKPVGYTALGLMCYEMMQSKVHWASDYPIALFVGYITGKTIANRRITKIKKEDAFLVNKVKYSWEFCTSNTWEGYQLLGVNIKFK